MKKTFIKNKFQKLLLENESKRNISNDKIKTIGIITTDEISKYIPIKEEIKSTFKLDCVKQFSFTSISKRKLDKNIQFSEKSFGWKSQIKQKEFNDFLNEPLDLLIGYFNKQNLFTEFAVLKSKARFKAGISNVNQKLYDIEIKEFPKNITEFLNELKKYLHILEKL